MSKTNKKILKEQYLNTVLMESYKHEDTTFEGSPVIASFNINVTTANVENHNGRIYPTEAWLQKRAFGVGGDYLDESGKLKPLSLLGTLDHKEDDLLEVKLAEASIAWADLKQDGNHWLGKAHVLDTPEGRITKTFLDYAKLYGGGEQIGVSTRAVGDARLVESTSGMVEEVIPEGFELISIDFVHNPSSIYSNAPLMEAKKRQRTLVESIQRLKENDKDDHKETYDKVISDLEKGLSKMDFTELMEATSIKLAKDNYLKQLKDTEYKLHHAIYTIDNMSDDEYKQTKYFLDTPDKKDFIKKLKKEYDKVLKEINAQESLTESKVKQPLEEDLKAIFKKYGVLNTLDTGNFGEYVVYLDKLGLSDANELMKEILALDKYIVGRQGVVLMVDYITNAIKHKSLEEEKNMDEKDKRDAVVFFKGELEAYNKAKDKKAMADNIHNHIFDQVTIARGWNKDFVNEVLKKYHKLDKSIEDYAQVLDTMIVWLNNPSLIESILKESKEDKEKDIEDVEDIEDAELEADEDEADKDVLDDEDEADKEDIEDEELTDSEKFDLILEFMADISNTLNELFAPIEDLEPLEDHELEDGMEDTEYTEDDIDNMTEEELESLDEFLTLEEME